MQFASPMVNAVGATVDEARITLYEGGSAGRAAETDHINSAVRPEPGTVAEGYCGFYYITFVRWELTLLNY